MSVATVGDNASLAQFFQRVQNGTSQAGSNPQVSSDDSSSSTSAQATQGQQVRGHHHHGAHPGSAARGKIESAVTDALQNYDGSGNVNDVITGAIKSAISSGAGAPASGTTTSTTDSSTTTTATDTKGSLQSLLQSHGVDASQFRDDMMAAFQSARGQNTVADPTSAASQALAPGAGVDVEA